MINSADSPVLRTHRTLPWWLAMLRDPHWWVPVIVLVIGLLVLQWIR